MTPGGFESQVQDRLAELRAENARLDSVVVSYALTERELKSKVDRLRAALEQIAKENRYPNHCAGIDCKRIARAALNEQKP